MEERAKKKVAFICVHNSCRSQIAEALGKHFIGRAFDDNWGLEDPTGKEDNDFRLIIAEIESKPYIMSYVPGLHMKLHISGFMQQ